MGGGIYTQPGFDNGLSSFLCPSGTDSGGGGRSSAVAEAEAEAKRGAGANIMEVK